MDNENQNTQSKPETQALSDPSGSVFVLLECWFGPEADYCDDSFVAVGDLISMIEMVPSGKQCWLPEEYSEEHIEWYAPTAQELFDELPKVINT